MLRLFPLIVLLCVSLFAHSQTDVAILSLEECVRYAVKHSTKVKKAGLDQVEFDYKFQANKGLAFPQVSGSIKYDSYPVLPTQVFPGDFLNLPNDIAVQIGKPHNLAAGIEFSQIIFDRQLFMGLQRGKSTQVLYTLLVEKTEEEVAYEVATNYMQALNTQTQLKIIEANMEKLRRIGEIAKVQFENDLITKTDVNRIRVNESNLRSKREQLLIGLAYQLNILKFLMGMPQEEIVRLDESLAEAKPNIDLLGSIRLNLEETVTHRLIKQREELNYWEQRYIKGKYFPKILGLGSLSAQAQRDRFSFFSTNRPWFGTVYLGVHVQAPLFDGFQTKRSVLEAGVRLQKLELDKAQNAMFQELSFAHNRQKLRQIYDNLDTEQANVELADEVYQQTTLQYKEGIASLTDLLTAETTLREARVNYSQQVIACKIAELDLMNSAGMIRSLYAE